MVGMIGQGLAGEHALFSETVLGMAYATWLSQIMF